MGLVFVIDDDEIMAQCVARAVRGAQVKIFSNGIEAMRAISEGEVPDLIFLDLLLDGPDGFTFLNELVSYEDTMRISVVVVTALDLAERSLAEYNVVAVLNKETMRPEEIRDIATRELVNAMVEDTMLSENLTEAQNAR